MIINPSLACADRLRLAEEMDVLASGGISLFHIDIMDNHYVPNLCFDYDTVEAIFKYIDIPLDVHLMVDAPAAAVERLASIRPAYISFHPTTTMSPFRLFRQIRRQEAKPGILINPAQRAEDFLQLLPEVDLVTVMSVEPGFAGQSFMPHTLETISALADFRKRKGLGFSISVDGGVNAEVGRRCLSRGADILVTGALTLWGQGKPLRQALEDLQAALAS